MFFLKLISLVIPGMMEPWPECQPKESQEAPKRHPGGSQEASRAPRAPKASEREILQPLSAIMQKFHYFFQFHEGFLRVTSILTAYLQ